MAEKTKEELYEDAKRLDIEGRSNMDRDELAAAVAKAEAGGDQASAESAESATSWTRGDGSPAPVTLPREQIEAGWDRGAELDDAEAVAAAAEEARLANIGSTGSAEYTSTTPTGGAKVAPVAEAAAEAAAIRGAASAREAEKVEQTGATNTTPAPDQEGAVVEGQPAVEEAGTGDAEPTEEPTEEPSQVEEEPPKAEEHKAGAKHEAKPKSGSKS